MTAKEPPTTTKTRVRYPKVKTGCITCRTRRVKCDETRPQCIRCLKYGTECGGYLPGRRHMPSTTYGTQQARALVPKNQSQHGGPLLILQPTSSLFESELELRYFRLFSDRIATEICRYFNPDAWSRMILQACVHEASIRHAAVAIGALGKTYEIVHAEKHVTNGESVGGLRSPTARESKPRYGGLTEDLFNESYLHHRRALEQYDKAIRRMRNDICSGNQSMRTTLIICIIIICFEAIHGNHESAAGQLQSGLALIQDWTTKQNRSLQHHPQGFSSPAPEVIEDFLVQSFGRMEIQSMSVFDPRPVEVHSVLRHEGIDTIKVMPTRFASIEEARIYLDLITRRILHWTSSIHVSRTSGRSLEKPAAPPRPANHEQSTAWEDIIAAMPWCDGKIPLSNTSSTPSSQSLIMEQSCLANEIHLWTRAFNPIFNISLASGGKDAISALTMAISSTASMISLRSGFFINESAYDQFIPEFRSIVDKVTQLLYFERSTHRQSSSPQSSSSSSSTSPTPSQPEKRPASREPLLQFAFDIGIVPPLYLVTIKCRDRKLRRRALKLMEDHPRREGVWDSVATVALSRWVIRLEEEGARRFSEYGSSESSGSSPRDEVRGGAGNGIRNGVGYEGGIRNGEINGERAGGGEDMPIPEEMRVRKASMRFDLLARKANFGCLQMDVETRMFVQKKQIFSW